MMYENIKKIFALSDVHGYFTQMKSALDVVGFDQCDPGHLLVFCGDMFDRGNETMQVFDYLTGLENKVLIRGNHEDRLIELFETKRLEPRDSHNQTDKTLVGLFGEGCIDANHRLTVTDTALAEKITRLYDSELNYFEFGDYIFTHGWLPSEVRGSTPYLRDDWRDADENTWINARWYEWQQMYSKRETACVPGKTIVCGHRPSSFGYMFDTSRTYDDYGIFYGDGVIAIDGWTFRSGLVNVLVIDVENGGKIIRT